MTIKYEWEQLSQWETHDPEHCVRHREVDTGLSKATCTFRLMENIDTGASFARTWRPVKEKDVTPEMLKIAGDF